MGAGGGGGEGKLTVTFNTNGGSAVNAFTVPYNTAAAPMAEVVAPTKEGYTFNGWATADGKSPADVATVPVDGVEFTAQWTKNSYTVNYFVKNPTTGEFDAVATATVAYGDPISTALVGIAVEDGYSLVETILGGKY